MVLEILEDPFIFSRQVYLFSAEGLSWVLGVERPHRSESFGCPQGCGEYTMGNIHGLKLLTCNGVGFVAVVVDNDT